MIVVMALAFVVAWTPFYIMTLVSQLQVDSFLRKSNFLFIMLAIHLAGFVNRCTNPLIYHVMSGRGMGVALRTLATLSPCCCTVCTVTSTSPVMSENSASEVVRMRQYYERREMARKRGGRRSSR
jgi:hypothetical protein